MPASLGVREIRLRGANTGVPDGQGVDDVMKEIHQISVGLDQYGLQIRATPQ